MSVILHIGHGKTGTSAIQSWLAINRDLLNARGLDYPADNHDKRAKEGKVNSGNRRAFLKHVDFDSSVRYLFSNENFFHDIGNKNEVGQKILDNSSNIEKVVIFTRDLYEMLCSSWGQYIKRAGGTEDINVFAEKYQLYVSVKKVIQVLESKNIPFEIRNYSSNKENIILTFLETIFADKAVARDLFEQSEILSHRVNRSLTLAEYELQRKFNYFYGKKSYDIVTGHLVNGLPNIQAEKPRLQEASAKLCLKKNLDAIQFINTYLPESEGISCSYREEDHSEEKKEFYFTEEQLASIARTISVSLKQRERQIRDLKASTPEARVKKGVSKILTLPTQIRQYWGKVRERFFSSVQT